MDRLVESESRVFTPSAVSIHWAGKEVNYGTPEALYE